MKDMTHEQLIRATYVVANYKDPETAKLLNELAGRLDCALVAARTACLERDASVRAEIEWEKAMRQAVGEDGIDDVVLAIEKLKARLDALVAENGQMLRLLTNIRENHLEYLSEGEDCMMAGVPLDYVSEINAFVSRDVEAENPFQATDSFLAEVRKQGVIEFAAAMAAIHAECQAGGYFDRQVKVYAKAQELAESYLKQRHEEKTEGGLA